MLESWLDFLIISRLVNFGKNGRMRRVYGEAVGQVIPGEWWKGPHIYITLLNFPGKDFFPTATETRSGGPWVLTIHSPKACPLKRQKRNCPFCYPCRMTWEETLFSSSLSPLLVFGERTIYKITKAQIPTAEKDFDTQTPYLQDRSNAFLIPDSPHREIFDLQKSLIWTFDFYGWVFLMWMRGQQSSPPHCFFCIQGLSRGLWCHL